MRGVVRYFSESMSVVGVFCDRSYLPLLYGIRSTEYGLQEAGGSPSLEMGSGMSVKEIKDPH